MYSGSSADAVADATEAVANAARRQSPVILMRVICSSLFVFSSARLACLRLTHAGQGPMQSKHYPTRRLDAWKHDWF
jgi:hypothetical protein